MKKFILIDGNSLIHRAFHAYPPFRTTKGQLVNAVYGFSSMLLTLLNNEKPHYIAASFDLKGKTFRHEESEDYKATRTKAPDELYEQIPVIKDIVRAFEIPIHELQGYEADDVIGTLARQAEQHNQGRTADEIVSPLIITSDRDALQLITEHTKVLTPVKGFNQTKLYDQAAVLQKYSLTPAQIIDLKGLQGDSSDNIKGVQGVGPKTATTLLKKYGTIDGIYQNIDQITGKLQERLVNGKDDALQSRHLATIVTDAPITLDLPACTAHEYDADKLLQIFLDLEFKSLVTKLRTFNAHSSARKIEASNTQPSLF